jgi:hypothetical protein
MIMKTNNAVRALLASALVGIAGAAAAAPVVAAYTVEGTSGDWTLNFDVANYLFGSDQSVYFFGVAVDGGSVAGSPASFDAAPYATWNNSGSGGSNQSYDDLWLGGGHVLVPGVDLRGFLVHSDAVDAPTSVNWFAYSSGSTYTGKGYFNTANNPGWEGVATVRVVPEPANIALLLAGLGICGLAARRRGLAR